VHLPVARSQILTILSKDADASRLPSCDQAIEPTVLVCPSKVDTFWPVVVSQILIVLSQDPDASRIPSSDQASDPTELVCSLSANLH
jgi:hypothetical protein